MRNSKILLMGSSGAFQAEMRNKAVERSQWTCWRKDWKISPNKAWRVGAIAVRTQLSSPYLIQCLYNFSPLLHFIWMFCVILFLGHCNILFLLVFSFATFGIRGEHDGPKNWINRTNRRLSLENERGVGFRKFQIKNLQKVFKC